MTNIGESYFLPKYFAALFVLFLIAISAFLRLHNAEAFHYNPDEALITSISGEAGLGDVLEYSHYEAHPPLFYFICHYWMRISNSPAFVRGLSLLFGLLTIPLYYSIGKLLDGKLTGLYCAAFIAFSRGCIIQSYVVRQYAVFLFLISLAFYCCLIWRQNRSVQALIAYAVIGCLAAATHFSCIFFIFCIGACEAISLFRNREKLWEWVCWGLANTPILLVSGLSYYLWLPAITMLPGAPLDESWILYYTLIYPVGISFYLFPSVTMAIPLACGFLITGILRSNTIKRDKELRFIFLLAGFALAFGMCLTLTGVYVTSGRHNIWIFPFLIPALGWILSDATAYIADRLGFSHRAAWNMLAVIVVCGIICGLYRPAERFADNNEYSLSNKEYEAIKQLYATLGPSDRIVMEREDAMMFKDIYPLFGNAPYQRAVHAVMTPYMNSQVIFDASTRRIALKSAESDLFAQAQQSHMLDGVNRLAFFYSFCPGALTMRLMLCPALDKKIMTFPASTDKNTPAPDDISNAHAAIMLVSKKVFLNEVLSSSGKAHACLADPAEKIR